MPDLRPAQQAVLNYDGGLMAVSAVPGSGKTFTLTQLAARLIAEGRVDASAGQAILIVTYLNASVDAFRARIRARLEELDLPDQGFDVRTLHSLGLEIVRQTMGAIEDTDAVAVMDEVQAGYTLGLAVDGWIAANRREWEGFLPEDNPGALVHWRELTEQMARAFIRTAKNDRFRPPDITARLAEDPDAAAEMPFIRMLLGIYQGYQAILERQALFDFDDLIWLAAEELERRPGLVEALRRRWPFVLEDEAQDSVPLQEVLLGLLTGPAGNWVRVGDPNQAITSTFTAAHPRFLRRFMDRPDVRSLPLPNSGRCAPIIYEAANAIVHWVCDHHPVPEVRTETFVRQDIEPTPPGDAQPNPEQIGEGLSIRAYRHREEEELPRVAELAARFVERYPDLTAAILVPTHAVGHALAPHLDRLGADYDNLLRGGVRAREIASGLGAVLALLADPLSSRALVDLFTALWEMEHPAAMPVAADGEPDAGAMRRRFEALLRGVRRPEELLFPADGDPADVLPPGVAVEADRARLASLAAFARHVFALRPLPIDDMLLALSDELFAGRAGYDGPGQFGEPDLALAYQLATLLRGWQDAQPEWRLPELSARLAEVARGRRSLNLPGPRDEGYQPEPGRITLATQHGAKGLEWDAVFLVGVDARWIPNTLEGYFVGLTPLFGDDDLTAEVDAQLRYLMAGDAGIFPGRSATESAHVEVICERLRLLYVGLTRARRFLHISRSRAQRRRATDQTAEPTTVMGVLYDFLKHRPHEPRA